MPLRLRGLEQHAHTLVQEHMGSSEEELAAIDVMEPVKPAPVRSLPPHNGFGSAEDSAQNCLNLLPRPPRKDIYKLVQKHRIVLRFRCRFMETGSHRLAPADRSATLGSHCCRYKVE